MPPLDVLKADIALDMLRGCLSAGVVIPTAHFLDELGKDGLELADAWHVIKSGAVSPLPAERDVKTGDWKYRVEGYTADGAWLVIVFCLKAINRAVLITAWEDKERRRSE